MKRIAMSMQVTEAENYFEFRNSIAFDYVKFFEELGFILVLIPNNTSIIKDYFRVFSFDGVVLSGGNNVNPELYGGESNLKSIYPERDNVERLLIELAINSDIPVLGICRGFQFINVFFGGSITHGVRNHVNIHHEIDSSVSYLNKLKINSFHNQGVFKEDLSNELDVIAISDDNVVEAFRHSYKKILGLQWHPERQGLDQDKLLIKHFFNS